jgi:hypothetical protein
VSESNLNGQSSEKVLAVVVEQYGEEHEPKNALQYRLALPIAKRFQKEIGETCNRKFNNGAQMAVTVAAFIFRSMLVNTVRQLYKNDVEAGKAFISKVYDQAKKDALEDWVSA